MESVAYRGDSGGSATIESDDGFRKLIGVKSGGVDPTYDADALHIYTYIGGW